MATWGVEPGFGRSGPVSQAHAIGIRTPQPLLKAPAFGGALGVRLKGQYADSIGLGSRNGPPKPASTPYVATTHLAPADNKCLNNVVI